MTPRVRRLSWLVIDSALVLPLGCVIALVWANIWPEPYYQFAHALDFAVDDVGLALFFGVMTKHVVEETLSGGALHSWRRALLPIVAAVGAVAVPIAIYVAYLNVVAEPMLVSAWVVTSAIDVAVCYLAGRLIFGAHPAVPFIVLLSIAANGFGLAVIALTDPPTVAHAVAGFAVVFVGALGAWWLRRRPTRSPWPYLLGPGVLCWIGLYLSGVHPALALLPVVPFMPHARRDPGLLADPLPEDHDTLSRFERTWEPAVQAVLFLFGLVNAGVTLHGQESGAWALPIAVFIGRPLGVVLAASLAISLGLHRTLHVGTRELVVIGLITATALTMALFFSNAVLSIGPLQNQLSLGALLTALSPLIAWVGAWTLGVGRFKRAPAHQEAA